MNVKGTAELNSPWLNVSGGAGNTPIGSSDDVTLNVDATGLSVGSYSCQLRVNKNSGAGTAFVPVTLNVLAGSTISGNITYNNGAMTPLTACNIDLHNNADLIISSTKIDATGYYQFPVVIDGDYTIQTTTTKANGGITTADGILANRIAAGLGGPYSSLQFLAADVNASGVVTTTDGGF